jgi:hypothetical protein
VLKFWHNKSYAIGYIKKGLESLKFVFHEFLNSDKTRGDNIIETNETDGQTPSTAKSGFQFFNSQSEDSAATTPNHESSLFTRDQELENEIVFFSSLLAKPETIKNTKSTLSFWKTHKTKMPKLFQLSIILLNITSTSAFIERFFSISGIVCDSRRLNMTEDLIIMRSLMKANIHILTELNETG